MILKSVYQDLPGGFSAVVFEELPPALILHHWVKSQKCGRGHKFVASAGMCLLDSFQNYCEVKKKKKKHFQYFQKEDIFSRLKKLPEDTHQEKKQKQNKKPTKNLKRMTLNPEAVPARSSMQSGCRMAVL